MNRFGHRKDSYNNTGSPPYGGAIQQNVYYAGTTLCDANIDYSRGGFPIRDVDESGEMAPWKTPFILMVDRGDCTFVKKVRNAQKAGAAGVLIADNTCLCDAGAACQPDEGAMTECETKEPIMADDGSGADVSIPSFLLFKQNADPIKDTLTQNKIVRAEMSWALPAPDSVVEYELWTTPTDEISVDLKKDFRLVASALGEHAQFTPHYYIYDGLYAGCRGVDGENQCYNLCTNNGRYCATDPDDDLDFGISGADVVTESLRQICIWNEHGDDGVGMPYWDYNDEFLYRCAGEDYFANEDCIKDAMAHAGIKFDNIQKCMEEAGGLEGDDENDLLEAELNSREIAGVVIMPSFFVNQAPLRGAMTTSEVFEAICAGFAAGSEPSVCHKCSKCGDVGTCVEIGHCPGVPENSVSMQTFMGTLGVVVLVFSLIGIIQYQRTQNHMRDQVRGIVAEYMPIDPTSKVESVGFPQDDEDAVELS